MWVGGEGRRGCGVYVDGWAERGYFQAKGERSLGNKLQTQSKNGWNLVGFNQRKGDSAIK